MRLTEFSVQRFQFTLVMFFLLAAMGWHAFQQIPRAEDPVFPIPVVTVVAVYPGADPGDMEKLVTDPIEDAINQTDDIKRIWSESEDGLSVVRVEYDWTKDAEKKYDEALREINGVREKLPRDLVSLKVEKASPGLVNIVQYALVGPNASARQLRKAAEDLQDRLEQVNGVRKVEIHGLPKPEVQVAVDLARLARFGIPLTQVVDTLKGENAVIPGGAIETDTRRFNLRTSGSYDSLEEIAATVIAGDRGKSVRLRDVADVRWDYEESSYLTRFNGQRAVFITASQKDDMNIFQVRDAVVAEAEAFRATLSPDLRLTLGFDQSRNVDQRLTRLGIDFAIAIGLVMITLLPLGLRAAGVVMVSIPLSMAIGIALLYFAGFSLNQLSIAGFVLALGLLVDDSIVVTENIERFLRAGYTRREAAIAATKQIYLAVLGCTATLLFAFLPLFMLPEGAGKFIMSMAAAVTFTVIASLFVSLTMIPFLASRWLSEKEHPEGNRLLQAVMRGIHVVYRPLLHRALSAPKTTLAIAGAVFVATLGLVPVIGFSLFPNADVPQFLITIETADGTSVSETDRAVTFVEQTLLARPEIKYAFSNTGRGNPRIFYNVFPRETRANVGEVYAEVHQYHPQKTPALFDELRRQFADYAGARIIVKPFENGPPIDAPIAIRLTGPELSTLRELAGRVETLIKATPGTRDVTNPVRLARTDIDLGIDAQKASLFGVPTASADRTARLAIAGESVGNFREPDGDEYAISVRLPRTAGHQSLDALDDIHVTSLNGAALPLKQIATPTLVTAPNVIQRYKRQRAVTVTAYAASGYNIEKVTDDILAALAKENLPAGYRYMAAGQREARESSFAGLNTAAMIAVFGILAVLILEFGNFRSTAIVAGVIPLGIIGGLVALFLSGYSLSFMAVVGFIALVGIEIKNSILLVDFTHQLRAEGRPLMEAIQEAGEVRFLPILLTSLTAIGGLMPLALQGSALYSPLAWVIIGGLVSSTFLARLVTPVMYLLLAPPMEAAESHTPVQSS
ncbi:MAG: efflux RND transporter permease subunit [Moraxellaceae bacterium]|nr:efflux RND transporter permease subunit [Moraxellaceae bacterium]